MLKYNTAERKQSGKSPNSLKQRSKNKATVIQSVDRAIDLLEELSQAGGNLSLMELSSKTELNPSTCHHLLATLCARGCAIQDHQTKDYSLGNKILELSDARTRQFNLLGSAQPKLKSLNRETGEAVHLAVLQARELVPVMTLESMHAVKVDSGIIGKSNAAHATALGKAILAWLPESEMRAIILLKGMQRFTEKTICDLEVLKNQLRQVRRHGFAVDREEFQPGVICIGAAIRDYTGAVIASLSCSIPTMRATEPALSGIRVQVMTAATELSEELGSRGHS